MASDSDDDDLLLELAKYTQHNPKREDNTLPLNTNTNTPQGVNNSSNANHSTTLVSFTHSRSSTPRTPLKQAPPSNPAHDLQLLLAKGEIAVLRSKLKALEVEREQDRKLFNEEKENNQQKYEKNLEDVKHDLNKLEDEKQFLKLQLKTTARMTNVHNKTVDQNASMNQSSNTILQNETMPSDLPSSETEHSVTHKKLKQLNDKKSKISIASDKKTGNAPSKTKIKLHFRPKTHTDENLVLLNRVLKNKIPGLLHPCVYYLDRRSGHTEFHDYAINIVSEYSLNKFIESILDYWLQQINDILNTESKKTELPSDHTRYIPFILSILCEIVKFRPSACDVDILVNLFIVIKRMISTFEYVFKFTALDQRQNSKYLQKYAVHSRASITKSAKDGQENWEMLYPESEYTSCANGMRPGFPQDVLTEDDSLFEIPTFHTEFVDIVIVIYSFDVLELISKSLSFQVQGKMNHEGDSTAPDDTLVSKIMTLLDDLTYLYKLSNTISFQPIFHPIYNVSMMMEYFLQISQTLLHCFQIAKSDTMEQKLFAKWQYLMADSSEWLIHLNLHNVLKTLPAKYNIHSLLRPIGSPYDAKSSNLEFGNLITSLETIMQDMVIYQPDGNAVTHIYFWNLLLTKQILSNISKYLFMLSTSEMVDFKSDEIKNILNNVIKLLSVQYPFLLKQTGKDFPLLQDIVVRCLRIIQHCHNMSLHTFHDAAARSSDLSKHSEPWMEGGLMKTAQRSTASGSTHSTSQRSASDSVLNDEKYKLELIVTFSRIVFQNKEGEDVFVKKDKSVSNGNTSSLIIKEICRDMLDTLITPDESDVIFDTLTTART
ncbi:hypothetical protein ACO0QE_002245 [Hanseniaspora vineae]